MKIKLILIVLFLPGCLFAQNRAFLEDVHKSKNCFYPENLSATDRRIDIIDFDSGRLTAIFIDAIKGERVRRLRPLLEQDSLLNRIAQSGIKTYNKSRFVYSKTWKMEKRNIKYALQHEHSANKIYAAHAFDLDLVDLKFAEGIYFDSRPGTSEINLYLGKRPQINDPENPDYVEPVPVEVLTERLLCERLIRLLAKGMYRRDLTSKKFSTIGVALKVDQTSLNKNTRPRIFVIVIFGGKQLQSIKVPQEMKNDNYSKLEE